ncbi:MAG: BTAD domain-containing putative transcriptional regulator [Thermodesulfobacteriota bacterium]
MNLPFSYSKIRPPRLRGIIRRDHLIETLMHHRDKKVILILGQAAQGKSTLAALYADTCRRPTAWINLSIDESDPVNLFRLVIHSLQSVLPDHDLSGILEYAAMDLGPREEGPLFRGWIHVLTESLPAPVQIVLDGLDRLSAGAPSFRLLRVFMEEPDANIRFLLLSRSEPPFGIHGWKMRREAAVITNEQLAFSLEETRIFFKNVHEVHFSQDQVDRIHRLAEGWVGGLLLFSEALRRVPKMLQEHFLTDTSLQEFKKEAFRYLGEEIFSSLNERSRRFLLAASILELMDPAVVREVLETEEAEKLLEQFSQKNLFVHYVYNYQNGKIFRFHQIFRDFLKIRFDLDTAPEEKRRLYLKAGRVYRRNGYPEYAMDCFLHAGAYSEAAEVLEHIGLSLLKSGRIGELAQRLGMIPDEFIEQDPWLLFFLSMTRRFTETRENSRSLSACYRFFQNKGETRGQILSLASLIESLLLAGYHPIPLKNLLQEAETLLGSIPADAYAYESAMLWLQLGHGWSISCGNPRKGYWCALNAVTIAGRCGDTALQVAALSRAVEAMAFLGEFQKADELLHDFKEVMENQPYPELRVPQIVALSELFVLRGETEKADEEIRQALGLIQKHGLLFWHPPALAAALGASTFSGKLDQAKEIGDNLLYMASSLGNRVFEGVVLFFKAMRYDRQGLPAKAEAAVEAAVRILSSDKSLTLWHYHGANVLRSRILEKSGSQKNADTHLDQALAYYRSISNYLFLVDTHLAVAFRKRTLGENTQAEFHIKEALRIHKEKQYSHLPALSREDFADACILALEWRIPEAAEYASHLLSTLLSDLADERLELLERNPDRAVAGHARKLRKTIYRASLPRLRIQSFGEFQVWMGDAPIQNEEWQRVQSKNLLKALITRGPRQASREVLMEDLWPDSDPRPAERNFKVTLHRLRKALEPELNPSYGSSYLHLKENRLSLDRTLCAIDLEAFLSHIETGEKEEAEGNPDTAFSRYSKAVELYRGDFLEEDLYSLWAESAQESLRKKYMTVLFKMGEIQERKGKNKQAIACYEKIVEFDPLMEEAYRKIMSLYADRGLRNAAIKTYEECRKKLYTALNCEPDAMTQAIYRKIIDDS